MHSTIAPGAQLFDCFFCWRSWAPGNVFGAQLLHLKKQSKSRAQGAIVERNIQEIHPRRSFPQLSQIITRRVKCLKCQIFGTKILPVKTHVRMNQCSLEKLATADLLFQLRNSKPRLPNVDVWNFTVLIALFCGYFNFLLVLSFWFGFEFLVPLTF